MTQASFIKAVLGWRSEKLEKIEKLSMIVNSQLFIIAAAVLTYQSQIQSRIGSWTTICIAEGFSLISAILLLLSIDNKSHSLASTRHLASSLLELAIVIAIIVEDPSHEAATIAGTLLLSSASEYASLVLSSVFFVFGIVVAATHNYTSEEKAAIGISIANIACTVIFRTLTLYIKMSKESQSAIGRRASRIGGKQPAKRESTIRRDQSQLSMGGKLVKIHPSLSIKSKVSQEDQEIPEGRVNIK